MIHAALKRQTSVITPYPVLPRHGSDLIPSAGSCFPNLSAESVCARRNIYTYRSQQPQVIRPVVLTPTLHHNRPTFAKRTMSSQSATQSFYDLKAELPGGDVYDFEQLKGKVVLVVNVASQWCACFNPFCRRVSFCIVYQWFHAAVQGCIYPANIRGRWELLIY